MINCALKTRNCALKTKNCGKTVFTNSAVGDRTGTTGSVLTCRKDCDAAMAIVQSVDSCTMCSEDCLDATCAAGYSDFQASGGDACAGVAKATARDTIRIGAYSNNAVCQWQITCATGPVALTFASFNTEANFDYVYFYDGADDSAPQLA